MGPDPACAPGLAQQRESLFPYYEVNFRDWLPADPAAPVLDYGCGAGGFLCYLEKLGYREVTGFDVDPRYAAFCRSHTGARIEHSGDGLSFLHTARDRYDCVFARGVVYYFPRADLQKWFAALAAAVRPGGRLMIEVFNGAAASGMWPYLNDPYIQTVFSEHSLRYLLERAGLRVLSLRGERYPKRGAARAIWLAGRRVLASLRRAVYVIERGRDDLNPTIFGKCLIAVAERPGREGGMARDGDEA